MTALLEKMGKWFISFSPLDRIILACCFLGITVVFDYDTGMLPVFILYVLCVVWSSNYIGGRFATGFALLAAFFHIDSPEFALHGFRPLLYLNTAATFLIVDGAIQFKNQLLDRLYQVLARVESQSLTDPLTGSANRRAFVARVEAALRHTHRYHEPFSLAYIDVDNFKTLNDMFGHRAGDRLLCRTIQVIQATLRGDDMVARLGGDEFGIVFTHAPQSLGRHVQRVKHALDAELQKEAAFHVISFSIGAVHYDGTRLATCEELIHFADSLMYEIKGNGKDGVRMATFSYGALPGEKHET
ncbi:GGDEF domain-containing protein [Noviherbaspirillum denitrificans]|uniref:diguanylate cyclase n=1 Tax=Noviherbaspirillum denitrificans TaxID=1968433 RepID=A0A254TCP8_9BURK|nr:GGDEF domain-containing protein [Noviherbaspirillum denitrificans]OWW20419.1 hypothetical protein AYR66_13920 [Noviherbaspirillum denitrificans]